MQMHKYKRFMLITFINPYFDYAGGAGALTKSNELLLRARISPLPFINGTCFNSCIDRHTTHICNSHMIRYRKQKRTHIVISNNN